MSSISRIEQQQAILIRLQNQTDQQQLITLVHAKAQAERTDALITLECILPEGSSHKIDAIRTLQTQLQFAATAQRPRWLCIVRADLLTIPAQNAFLKILEEPPPHTILILCSSFPEKLLQTVRSRTLELSVGSLATELGIAIPILESSKTIGPTYSELQSLSIAHACELAEQFSDRESAQQYIEHLLQEMHVALQVAIEQTATTSESIATMLAIGLHTLKLLEANCSVKLVMAEFFFQISDAVQIKS